MSAALEKLQRRIEKTGSMLCVGLDPVIEKIPDFDRFSEAKFPVVAYLQWIIDETHEFAAAYKPNSAFFEVLGDTGHEQMRLVIEYIQKNHPDIFIIDDAKRGDIGNTNEAYAKHILDDLDVDAATLSPYTGEEGLKPFLKRSNKASIILCKTSNEGGKEFQDLMVGDKHLWEVMAEHVSQQWENRENCMLVVGATYPSELKRIREIAPNMFFLVPGVGTQGGTLRDVLENGLMKKQSGVLINASSSIIFAESPREKAREMVEEMKTIIEEMNSRD